MITKKEKKNLKILDLICFILSGLSLVFFAFMFGVTESNFRYVFILFIMYSFYSFTSSLNELEV